MKVQSCHSFIIRTLVDLQLSVISTSELVLVSSNQPCLFCTSVVFILFVSTSARFILFVSTKAVRACQAPEKFCGEARWSLKASQLRTFATSSPVKISIRSRIARTQLSQPPNVFHTFLNIFFFDPWIRFSNTFESFRFFPNTPKHFTSCLAIFWLRSDVDTSETKFVFKWF